MVPPLTSEEAAQLHQAALLAVCERVTRWGGATLELAVTPDERSSDLARITGTSPRRCFPQGDGTLGDRLTRAVDRAFSGGAESVLLLGADSPTLPPLVLDQAIATLTQHDAVLGPCDDGGYYLLGLRRAYPTLFRDINWGSSTVARQTRRRAADEGIDLHELQSWYDLDQFSDLTRASRDLADAISFPGPAAEALKLLIDRLLKKHGPDTHASR